MRTPSPPRQRRRTFLFAIAAAAGTTTTTTVGVVDAFATVRSFAPSRTDLPPRSVARRARGDDENDHGTFDPLGLSSPSSVDDPSIATTATTALALLSVPSIAAAAAASSSSDLSVLSRGNFNPDNFKPVCAASDGFYRFLQSTTEAVVGEEQFVEYGPLIAGGLLRVRLELCVVESFFNEAVGPFVQKNGLTWILPLHETVETFLAGTIFALATTFILVGSTKIVSVVAVYGDVFLGGPCRLLGGFFFDRARGKPVTLDVGFGPWKKRLVGPPLTDDEKEKSRSKEDEKEAGLTEIMDSLGKLDAASVPLVLASGSVKTVGELSKIFRDVAEGVDIFVGRYLVIIATGYIGIKFVHFKIFPDFPPF